MAEFIIDNDVPSFTTSWQCIIDSWKVIVTPDLQINRYRYALHNNDGTLTTEGMLTSSQLNTALTTLMGEAPTFVANHLGEKPIGD